MVKHLPKNDHKLGGKPKAGYIPRMKASTSKPGKVDKNTLITIRNGI